MLVHALKECLWGLRVTAMADHRQRGELLIGGGLNVGLRVKSACETSAWPVWLHLSSEVTCSSVLVPMLAHALKECL